jgi:hypothetical protein
MLRSRSRGAGWLKWYAAILHITRCPPMPSGSAFRYHVTILWHRTLRRRSQKDWTSWERISHLVATYLPPVRILHPWPSVRFAVKHPRWESGARIAPAGICAGGAR